MSTMRVNATMDSDLVARLDAFARRRMEDRSTAIRQLVDLALRAETRREAVDAYRRGRLTLREFATMLDVDYWQAQDVLAEEGVAIAQGGYEETAEAVAALVGELGGSGTQRSGRPTRRSTKQGRPKTA